jgi:hypothetical protein
MIRSAQTVHLSCVRLTLSPNWPKWASTWPMSTRTTVRCTQKDFHVCGTFGTNHAPVLCRDQHYLQTDPNGLPIDPRHVGVPSGASKMISEPNTCSAQTVHLSCVDINAAPNGLKWASTWSTHVRVSSRASKMIFEPMVLLAQTMHWSSVEINIVSKRTDTSFHLTHVT